MITIEADRFPVEDVTLVQITDVGPYLRGHEEFLRSIRRRA